MREGPGRDGSRLEIRHSRNWLSRLLKIDAYVNAKKMICKRTAILLSAASARSLWADASDSSSCNWSTWQECVRGEKGSGDECVWVRREAEIKEGGAHVAAFEQLNVLPEHAQCSLQQQMLQMLPPALRAASRE